jgi:peptidyl-prolyl cis-trans isomerase D
MLQSFRDNTQSIVVKIIVGFIIITFALFGVDSLVGLAGRAPAPITVNGVDISERQIEEGMEMQRRQLLAQMGENADPSLLDDSLLRGPVVENLIERELLRQAAESQGLRVSEQFLDSAILSTREFQVDGQFDRNQFEALLRNVGMTPLMYRDSLRSEVVLSQGRNGVIASAFVLAPEMDKLTQLDQQKRSFRMLEVSVADVTDGINVSDEDAESYYQANQSKFKSEEQISVNYVVLDRQQIAETIEIDEAELQGQFERFVDDFEGEEARDADHILVTISDERSEQEALTQILDLMKKIDGGQDFADVAREFSDDSGSAEEGGNLGFVEKGVMVPEFEEALFDLSVGQISEPVRTDFGYHLIRLNKVEGAEAPSFDEVRKQLERDQQLQKAESEFVSQSEQLDDLRFSSSDLAEVSEVLGLEIKTTEFFGREGGKDELTQSPRLLAAAFSEEVLESGENSELIELDNNRILVVNLKEHKPTRTQELSEVKEQVIAEVTQQRASEQVKTQATKLLEKAKSEGQNSVVAEGYNWSDHNDIGRGVGELAPEVISAVFKMKKPDQAPTYSVIGLADGSSAVIVLESVSSGNAEFDEAQLRGMNALLSGRMGQSDYRDQIDNMRSFAEIERQ